MSFVFMRVCVLCTLHCWVQRSTGERFLHGMIHCTIEPQIRREKVQSGAWFVQHQHRRETREHNLVQT